MRSNHLKINNFKANLFYKPSKTKKMMPGPDIIYKCPKCGSFLKNKSLMSGNTIGACHYSDGKVIAMMMPELPYITKCQKCNTIFWLEEECEIGSYDLWDKLNVNTEWINADQANFLTIDEYFEALDINQPEFIKQEYYLRLRIWWAYNDRVRWKGNKLFINEQDGALWKANLKKLLELLDLDDDNDKIMAGEIYRNLGDFEKCMSIIQSISDSDFKNVKDAFIKECNARNTKVFQFKESD